MIKIGTSYLLNEWLFKNFFNNVLQDVVVNNVKIMNREFYSISNNTLFLFKGGRYIMNSLLSESIINQFDYNNIKKKITDFISCINLLCLKLKNIEQPKITQNYEIRYNCFVPTTSSKVEKFVINKIYLEDEIKEIISKYTTAVNSLNELERKVFINSYIYETKDEVMSYEIGLNPTKLLQVKKSASIKFSTILNL